MQHALFTQASAGERDREESRALRADQPSEVAAGPSQGPWSVVLGLQRSAGNAAVTRMLQGRGSSTAILMPFGGRRSPATAPISVSRQADDDEWGESSSEWSSGGETESGAGSEWSSGESGGGYGGGGGGGEYGGGSEEPAESSWGTDEEAGSQWSGGESEQAPGAESGGGSGGGESEQSPGAEWSGGGGPGAGWSGGGSGGGEEETGEDSGSWWPFDGGDEESEGDSGPSWWPFDGGDEESEEDDGEHSDEDVDRKNAEGETGSEVDDYVPTGGGSVPYAAPARGGFHDGGRAGTERFGDLPRDEVEAEHDDRPRVFIGGGRTGTKVWSGGGPFGGPKGNQESGTMHNTEPYYDSQGNGPFSDADAWVRDGTGIAEVRRDYVASNPGDQGNGWWISPAAASALEAHEQRHVASSKSLYESHIQPIRDRVLKSATTGKGLAYLQSDARTLLKRQIGWAAGIKKFVDEDKSYNGKSGQLDTQEIGTSVYPRGMHGPRTIQGKEYESYLIMGSEPDPT